MLTQKMSKEAFAVTAGTENAKTLKATMALFEKTLKGLKSGDSDLDLPPTKDTDIINQLDKVSSLWINFKLNLNSLLSNKDKRKSSLAYVNSNNIALLKEMNKAVKLYEKAAKRNVDGLKRKQFIAVFISSLSIILGWFFCG